MWNPNNWTYPEHEFRIYGDANAQTWCVVDEKYYHTLVRWRWRWKRSGKGSNKHYLARVDQVTHSPRVDGVRDRTQHNLFLHVAVMQLAGKPKPRGYDRLDHVDGDESNCREENLVWSTRKRNGRKSGYRIIRPPHVPQV